MVCQEAKLGVNDQSVCVCVCVCLLGRAISVHICMYGCFANGVCMHGRAVLEASWRPAGIYWN